MRKSWAEWHFPRVPQSVVWRYATALAAFLISFLLREALDPWLFSDCGFILFLPAIVLATFFAGLGPGIALPLCYRVLLSGTFSYRRITHSGLTLMAQSASPRSCLAAPWVSL